MLHSFSYPFQVLLLHSDLLWATDVYNVNGTVIRTVLVLDPTMEHFSPQHLQYVIPAITILFFLGFCPTLFLCVFSTRLIAKCFRFGPRTQLFLQMFTDAFQNCYKDGQNGMYDFRCLSSAPMFLYLGVVIWTVVNIHPDQDYWIASDVTFFITSCCMAYIQPYKSAYMNFSLSFRFIVMGIMIYLWLKENVISSHSLAVVLTFLVSLPHLLALLTVLYYVLMRIRFTRTVIQSVVDRILTLSHHTFTDV